MKAAKHHQPTQAEPKHAAQAPRIPATGHYTETARRERLAFWQETSGQPLDSLRAAAIPADQLEGSLENYVGTVAIPVGLAGPLRVRGRHEDQTIYAPLATTEAALVASVTRGARLLTAAGGVEALVLDERMIRAPIFRFGSARDAARFGDGLQAHLPELQEVISEVSAHAQLICVEPSQLGNQLNVSFVFTCGDASGQNMVTRCTQHVLNWLRTSGPALGLPTPTEVYIESNLSGDKKLSAKTATSGRGLRVTAECRIPGELIHRHLRISAADLVDAWRYSAIGAAQAGMTGMTINAANVIAAIFVATGQDIACVHESSVAQLVIEPQGDDIYVSMTLPSLVIGTVGGGTQLPAAQDMLAAMGCLGAGRKQRFAEIIASLALALDLSTLAAVRGGQFARAHERLGRRRDVPMFGWPDLDLAFFKQSMVQGDDLRRVESIERIDTENGILSSLLRENGQAIWGSGMVRLHEAVGFRDVFVKVKAPAGMVQETVGRLASLISAEVSTAYEAARDELPFAESDHREIAMAQVGHPELQRLSPGVQFARYNPSEGMAILGVEALSDVYCMDRVVDIACWTPSRIRAVLEAAATVHSLGINQPAAFADVPLFQVKPLSPKLQALSATLINYAADELPELVTPSIHAQFLALLEQTDAQMEAKTPLSLIHYDFNPRNLGFRRRSGQPVIYDWEFAAWGLPQRDVAEFLAFSLTPADIAPGLDHLLAHHRASFSLLSGLDVAPTDWQHGFAAALQEFALMRLPLYWATHAFRRLPFVNRLTQTTVAMLNQAALT